MAVRVECPEGRDILQLLLGTTVVTRSDSYCARQEDPQGFLWLPWVWGMQTSRCNICLGMWGAMVDLM